MNVVRSMRIDHWLSETQKKYPQKTAIIFKGKNWTFTKLNILISETSSFLQNQCKLKTGDRFCFYGLNNPEQIILLFAASKIGAIIFPINWRLANP
jgi:fatty-acyl-CoA synthase